MFAPHQLRRAVAAAVVIAVAGAVSPERGAAHPPVRATESVLERAILDELNVHRRAAGLRGLRASRALASAARAQSADQLAAGEVSHAAAAGAAPQERLRGVVRAAVIGEVIAWRAGTRARAAAIVRQWLRSPAHRAAVLDGRFTRAGVGAVRGRRGGRRGTLVTADLASG